MLFIVNHNPSAPDVPSHALHSTVAILDEWGADYRVWLGQYSADAHLKHKLEVLMRVPVQVGPCVHPTMLHGFVSGWSTESELR